MALTDDQKGLLRLMITHVPITDVQLKAWSDMSDSDILDVITTWAAAKKVDLHTSLGVYNKIISLGG